MVRPIGVKTDLLHFFFNNFNRLKEKSQIQAHSNPFSSHFHANDTKVHPIEQLNPNAVYCRFCDLLSKKWCLVFFPLHVQVFYLVLFLCIPHSVSFICFILKEGANLKFSSILVMLFQPCYKKSNNYYYNNNKHHLPHLSSFLPFCKAIQSCDSMNV